MTTLPEMQNNEGDHILITGYCGAIGRYCVAEARQRGFYVSGLGHGQWETSGAKNTIDFSITSDITIPSLTSITKQAGKIDKIIHLAGGSHVGRSFANPDEDFQRTVLSAQQLLEWARLYAPDVSILFVSTAAVYGDKHNGLITEEAHLSPTSPYGTHKLMMEQLVQSYVQNFGLSASIIRPFSVYGPGLYKQMIWELSKRLKASGEAPILGGTGTETRDWVYLPDAAHMLLHAVSQIDTKGFTVNLCTGQAVKIADIAHKLCDLWDCPAPQFSGQHREGDPRHLVGDAAIAKDMGIVAKTSLDEGLAMTVEWIKAEFLAKE